MSDHIDGLFIELLVLNLNVGHHLGFLGGYWCPGCLGHALSHPLLVSLAIEVSVDSIISNILVVEAFLSDVTDLGLVVLVSCY